MLVVGAPWLAQSVQDAGLRPVQLATDEPVAVVQGHSPDTGWRNLAEACIALRAGADWVACNVDSTLPTDRGLLPGNGAMVAALVAATGLRPAGRRQAGTAAAGRGDSPHVVAARRWSSATDWTPTSPARVAADVPSLLVLTGVSTAADLLVAPPALPAHVPGVRPARARRGGPRGQDPGHGPSPVTWSGQSGWTAACWPSPRRTRRRSGDAVTDASALRALALLAAHAWARGWLDRHPHCAGVARRPRGQRRADALSDCQPRTEPAPVLD